MSFNYYQPTKIVFGANKVEEVGSIAKKYGSKALVVGPVMNSFIEGMFKKVEGLLSDAGVDFVRFYEVEPNPSSDTVDKAFMVAKENSVELVIAVGGGSSMDVAKVIGLCSNLSKIDWDYMFTTFTAFDKDYPSLGKVLPVIAISTTAGTGSQCTQASVITNSKTQEKSTIFHPENFAEVAIVDPVLTLTLPKVLTTTTAFDAFSHSFESYLRNDNNYICEIMSLQAISNIVENLAIVVANNQVENREKLSMADTFGGIALSNCGACLPHPLSEIIGSIVTNMSHGQGLAMVYPAFVKHTYKKYEKKFARVCRIFDKTYLEKSDEVAAKDFHLVLTKFLIDNDLNYHLSSFCQDSAVIAMIKNLPVWQHLPMEETSVIMAILTEVLEA